METCAALGCPPVPGNTCHCSRCHHTLATLTSFDAHLVHPPGSAAITGCLPPASMGLVQDDRGTWVTPEGLAWRARNRAEMLARNAARHGREGAGVPGPARHPAPGLEALL